MRTLTALLMRALLMLAAVHYAYAANIEAALGESVVMIDKGGFFSHFFPVQLETTIFRPAGSGPYPLVIVNHGKAEGDPHLQGRYRPIPAVRYFLQRGYVVAVPMRQGFSRSSGSYDGAGCNLARNGLAQAEDVAIVYRYMATEADVDATHVLIVGQSHGGLTTMAAGTLGLPGVRGLINFAGGLRQSDCPGWQNDLVHAFATYGRRVAVPSIWFYGDNDSYFAQPIWQAMERAYCEAGGTVDLIAFGRFASDAHRLFLSRAGETIWQPEVNRFLEEIGMPDKVIFPQYAWPEMVLQPPPSGFAALDAIERLPYVKEAGRDGYRRFLAAPLPRAFAIARNGAWGSAHGGDDALADALERCNTFAGKQACQLYAVDQDVVWAGTLPATDAKVTPDLPAASDIFNNNIDSPSPTGSPGSTDTAK